MQRLLETHGYTQTRKGLRSLAIHLEGYPETEGLAPSIRKKKKGLEDKREIFEEIQAKRFAGTSRVNFLDQKVDAIAAKISRHILLETDNNREDTLYLRLFPKAPSDMFGDVSGDEQAKFVGHLVNTIREHDSYKSLGDLATTLDAAHRKLKAAESKRDGLLVKESQARTEFLIALEDAKRTYNLMYPRLQLTFPDDQRFVETFFVSFRSTPKNDEEKGE